jgi:hypothetical protein
VFLLFVAAPNFGRAHGIPNHACFVIRMSNVKPWTRKILEREQVLSHGTQTTTKNIPSIVHLLQTDNIKNNNTDEMAESFDVIHNDEFAQRQLEDDENDIGDNKGDINLQLMRIDGIQFVDYADESQLDHVMSLVGRDLSEPYSSTSMVPPYRPSLSFFLLCDTYMQYLLLILPVSFYVSLLFTSLSTIMYTSCGCRNE